MWGHDPADGTDTMVPDGVGGLHATKLLGS